MAFPTASELTEFIEPITTRFGLDVEEVRSRPAGKKSAVIVAVDADQRPSLDVLEELSNAISEAFDDAEASGRLNFGAGYTLEVSTPGVDAALTLPRHWRRNRHRLVDIAGQKWRIGALNDEETKVVLVAGKKIRHHELANGQKAVVQIEFSKPPQAELELTALPFDDVQGDDK